MKDRLADMNRKLQQLFSLVDSLFECLVEERPADNELTTKYREIRDKPLYLDMKTLTFEDVEHHVHQGIMKTWCEPKCVTSFRTAWRECFI
ncbi:hypothetical protein N7493_005954 [Penicillium malachiteum]|uniref:Uncharacterized protein n=1 Tax=Penicillium malachiteum TaxID=1324776 RepID=A0AAD6MW34_9EURO|nr:hypothetical protein N7493_005954 [Penicillium malachiteum]